MDNDGKSNLSPQDSQQGLQQKSQKITTTIDRGLTKKVETIADGVLFNLAKRNVQDYGVLVVDRKTHGVRVLIGGKNYQ
jgi:membrane peptidoglycan carboxypeptidase